MQSRETVSTTNEKTYMLAFIPVRTVVLFETPN